MSKWKFLGTVCKYRLRVPGKSQNRSPDLREGEGIFQGELEKKQE